MFSGIDAPKHAWQLICSACVELWGFSPGIVFDFSAEASVCVKKKLAIVTIIKYKFQVAMPASVSEVEKKKDCQQMLLRWFPNHCLFGKVEDMIKNDIPQDTLLDPKKVVFSRTAHCLAHNKQCPIKFKRGRGEMTAGVLGAPCVLFSKILRQKLPSVS